MKTFLCPMQFKGDREYVQGTDLTSTVCDLVGREQPKMLDGAFQISFHKIMTHQCQISISDTDKSSSDVICRGSAEFCFILNGERLNGCVEETDLPIQLRVPFEEFKIVQQCEIKGESVGLNQNQKLDFLPMEILVAMTKFLHQSLVPRIEGSSKKWVFTKLDLRKPLKTNDMKGLRVELVQNMNQRLTRSIISVDGQSLGQIYFSQVEAFK